MHYSFYSLSMLHSPLVPPAQAANNRAIITMLDPLKRAINLPRGASTLLTTKLTLGHVKRYCTHLPELPNLHHLDI